MPRAPYSLRIHPTHSFFQISYAILVAAIMGLMSSRVIGTKHQRPYIFSIVCYMFGFAVWLIDNHFCQSLEEGRSLVGPLAPLLQLHAWWHIGVVS